MALFHYTDAPAVYSILLNQKLWLTDVRFLNDSKELHDGIGRLYEELKVPTQFLFGNNDYRLESIEYLKNAFDDTVSLGITMEPIFVFSLGREENLLSQWRAYGSYAIEFDEKLLQECMIEANEKLRLRSAPAVRQCFYGRKEKDGKAKNAVTNALANISQEMGRKDGSVNIVSIDSLSDLIGLAATFKDEGFSEEREVRIVAQVDECNDFIKYRLKDNRLIPYLEVPISLDCIKSINVGPMSGQELAYVSMAAFVRKVEKDWQNRSMNIEYELSVQKSSIPYRAKL